MDIWSRLKSLSLTYNWSVDRVLWLQVLAYQRDGIVEPSQDEAVGGNPPLSFHVDLAVVTILQIYMEKDSDF